MRWWDGTQWGQQTQPLPGRGQEPQIVNPQQPYGQHPRQPSFMPNPQYGTPSGQPPYQGHSQYPGARRPQPGPPSGHHGRPPRKSWPRRHKALTVLGGLVALIIIASIATAAGGGNHASPSTPAAAKSSPTPAATSPAFPPPSLAAFKAFAATGDASEVTQVGFVSNGLPSCPEPTYYVTIPSSLGVRAVEADLSAFFVQKNGFASNACGGAVVFAYHSLSDYNANKGNVFTAGRVIVTTNSPGPPYNLEVDAGADLSPTGSFSFNF